MPIKIKTGELAQVLTLKGENVKGEPAEANMTIKSDVFFEMDDIDLDAGIHEDLIAYPLGNESKPCRRYCMVLSKRVEPSLIAQAVKAATGYNITAVIDPINPDQPVQVHGFYTIRQTQENYTIVEIHLYDFSETPEQAPADDRHDKTMLVRKVAPFDVAAAEDALKKLVL